MRIDRFTEIVNIDDRVFLFNIKTGAMDEVNTHIANELLKLQRKGSFTPLECNLKESLIEEMIDRGYITYYSDREETDERKWFLAKHKEKAKKEEKLELTGYHNKEILGLEKTRDRKKKQLEKN